MDRDQAVMALTAELIESRLRAGELFTTLDISNGLKLRRWPIRHGEVAQAVRKIYDSGALQRFAYGRALIDVNTDSGATITQAFVYLPKNANPDDYARRIQDALPPVAEEIARDLQASVPVSVSALLTANRGVRGFNGRRSRIRQDGALPVPRRLIRQAGWGVNDMIGLRIVSDAASGSLSLEIAPLPSSAPTDGRSVSVRARVWNDLRVRFCRSALQRASEGNAFPVPPLPAGSWMVQGTVIRTTG